MSMIDGVELTEFKPKMSQEAILEFAGFAWAFPETSHIEMDVTLAKAFAEVIDIIVNGGYNTVDSYVQNRNQFHEDDKTQLEGG